MDDSLPNENAKTEREQALFAAALERSELERDAFLDGACGEDQGLRDRLRVLLEAHAEPDELLEETEGIDPTTLESDRGDESTGTQISHYKLLEKLGEGGFGSVWAAEQKEPVRRRVALKIIKLGMDTKQVVARFEAERQALAMMDHPNIAKVLDAGSTDTGRPYFVMELVKGVPITKYCDQEKLDTQARLDLFIKVCQAIQHAHQKGIIHRDIKPSNIMVTLHDGVPVPKVIDFGIAKATQQELTEKTIYTQYSQFIGTPAYMSPEQAEMSGLDIDTRSDIYSLGVLLYELLTGTTPFDTKELMQSGLDEMRKIIREREPAKPSTRLSQTKESAPQKIANHKSKIENDLDWIVMKCLEKDRVRRYETSNGLAADIKRHLENEPIVARPPSAAYKLQKAWRRNRLIYTAGAAITLALLVGITISVWQASEATAAREEADLARIDALEQKSAAVDKAEEAARERERAKELELIARRRAYASDMNLVQRSLELNDLGNARRLLNRHRPSDDADEDLRGWEWRYLWKQVQSDFLFKLPKEGDFVYELAASSDGNWLAAIIDERLVVWNLWTRKSKTLLDTSVRNWCMDFSPIEPWVAVVITSQGGDELRVVDVRDFTTVSQCPVPKYTPAIVFTPGGDRLVSVSNDLIRVSSVADGGLLKSIPFRGVARSGFGRPLAIAPDGIRSFVGKESGEVACIDLNLGTVVWTKQVSGEPIMAVDVSPDRRTLAVSTGALESAVILLDRANGEELGRFVGHRAWIGRVIFLDEGRYLASSSADQTVMIWDTHQMKRVRVLRGHEREIHPMVHLPDSRLVTGSKIGEVIVWNANPESTPRDLRLRPGQYYNLSVLSFTPDGDSLVVVDQREGRISLWTGEEFMDQHLVVETAESRAHAVLEPNGWRIAWSSRQGHLEIVDLRLKETTHRFDLGAKRVVPLAFNQEHTGVWLRVAGKNELQEWVFGDHAPRRVVPWSFHTSYGVLGTIWTSGGPWIAGREYDSRRFQFLNEVSSEVHRFDLLTVNERTIDGAFSHDLKWLAVSHEPGFLSVWDVSRVSASMAPKRVITLGGAVMSYHGVAFTPDNRRLAASSGVSQMVTLWDTDSFEPLLTLPGQGWGVQNIAISPDGNTIVAGGEGLHTWTAPSMEQITAVENAGTSWFKQP